MTLALNPPILEFMNNGLKTWISRCTQPRKRGGMSLIAIKDVLLLSRKNMVILF